MPKISFVKKIPPIEVPPGANLMRSLLDAGLPVASSCGGEGICGKCRVRVLPGASRPSDPEGLTPIEDKERFLIGRYNIEAGTRISCQAQVLHDVTVDTSYW